MSIRGRVAVVTGGSGGIGGAISKRLIAEAAGVYVLDLKPSAVTPFAWRQILFVDTR